MFDTEAESRIGFYGWRVSIPVPWINCVDKNKVTQFNSPENVWYFVFYKILKTCCYYEKVLRTSVSFADIVRIK